MREDHIFWSSGRVQINKIDQRDSKVLVQWSCAKERIKKRGPYILAEWLFAKERRNEREPYMLVEWSCAIKK